MSLERSCHFVETVIGRLPAIGLKLSNCLGGNILRFTHHSFEAILLISIFENPRVVHAPLETDLIKLNCDCLEVRTLADLRPVDLVPIRVVNNLDRLDDYAICVKRPYFLDYADLLHEGLHVADNSSLGASRRHARVLEAVGLDFDSVELVEEEGLPFSGANVGHDAGGKEDRQEQKWEHDL